MVSNNLTSKRITVFAGHYGSGKTNIAVNYAIYLNDLGNKTVIADLDIVNPYFRTKDSEKILKDKGIKLISSEYANTNVDVPALPAETYSVFADKDCKGVLDVGGDDRGALALGRYVPLILEENDYEMLFVINKHRFMTGTPEGTIEIMKEIEDACGLKFTGIVNNSNIGEETTVETVVSSMEYAKNVSQLSGLPIKMTTVWDAIYDKAKEEIEENLFPLKMYVKQSWLKERDE
ncbi:MAG: hypothetical protein J6C17_05510 [Clostridia bacterium]|nr:hypothetical protein [Clostridia bacterium]